MTKSTKETIVNPPLLPPMNHGMRELNRALFKAKVPTFGIKIPLKSIGQYLKKIDVDLLNQPKLRNLTEYDANHKLLLLKAACYKDGELDKSILSEATIELVNQADTEIFKHEIDLTYEYWPTEAVLKSVFPPEIQVPTSFSTIGHIAHFNLKPEHDDYKKILGQVILDKNPNIKTVVNKLDTIDNTFRNFKMELLAGEDNMIAEVRENTCRFKLDFSKVYWNSRLHAEHERLIDSFGSEALVCDGFAGIGPFAIPAAKKGCTVYANDLNPESVKWLKENIKLNKLNKKVETIFASQGSAADFFPEVFTKLIDNQLKESSTEGSVKVFDHVVMNLPATAIEFLGSFKGCITNETLPESISNKCTIHCHSFSKVENALEDLVDRASHYLGFALDASECSAHWVRSVAPNKDMYCLSFVIPNEYLCKATCDSVIDSRPVTKKIKLDTDENKTE